VGKYSPNAVSPERKVGIINPEPEETLETLKPLKNSETPPKKWLLNAE
jgi:hypothetical protein